ncbi:MAG: hypothetical protein AAFY26_14120, partial [Cyanobacteria bacterium J06638_22]
MHRANPLRGFSEILGGAIAQPQIEPIGVVDFSEYCFKGKPQINDLMSNPVEEPPILLAPAALQR